MTLGDDGDERAAPEVPVTDKGKMIAAGVLLLIPVVALMWVPSYARETPQLFGFPFFFWYQFAWVFICSGLTWTAYKLVLAARR
jgi:Protein of unknown function (DUF3311)